MAPRNRRGGLTCGNPRCNLKHEHPRASFPQLAAPRPFRLKVEASRIIRSDLDRARFRATEPDALAVSPITTANAWASANQAHSAARSTCRRSRVWRTRVFASTSSTQRRCAHHVHEQCAGIPPFRDRGHQTECRSDCGGLRRFHRLDVV